MEISNRYRLDRKTINRYWINYLQVDYGPLKLDGKNHRSWKDKKLERTHFGIGLLVYRTVKRMKIVHSYLQRHKVHRPPLMRIVVKCEDKNTVRKFYKFLELNKGFTIFFTKDTEILFREITNERKLKIFRKLGS